MIHFFDSSFSVIHCCHKMSYNSSIVGRAIIRELHTYLLKLPYVITLASSCNYYKKYTRKLVHLLHEFHSQARGINMVIQQVGVQLPYISQGLNPQSSFAKGKTPTFLRECYRVTPCVIRVLVKQASYAQS